MVHIVCIHWYLVHIIVTVPLIKPLLIPFVRVAFISNVFEVMSVFHKMRHNFK